MRSRFLVVVALVLSAVPSRALLQAADGAAERPLKVFVLAGTSNMLGGPAKIENLPDDLREPLAEVLTYRGGEWVPIEAGKNLVGNEATFGRAMAKHLGQPVGIVWTSVRYVASNSPGPALQNIVKQSGEKGRPVEIAGMLLDVSYGDGNKEETAKAYGEGLIRWVETARRDLGDANLPIVLMRAIPPRSSPSPLETVRRAQDGLALPSFRLVNSDEIERGGDRVHFTTVGRLELGRHYAAAMIDLLPAK
jgi:carbohydrate esterase-like sialic acid-specific acetylesterase